MSKHVDALLVINNERLRDVYSDISVMNAFGKADDTLSIAAKSIAEIITLRGIINLDFNDVKTVLKDGGTGYYRCPSFPVAEQQRYFQLQESVVRNYL